MTQDPENTPPSLDSVMQQLDALKKTKKVQSTGHAPSGDAARIAIDFASASAVGCMLGYGLDYWQGTGPWGLIGGLVLGVATGCKLMFDSEARDRRKAEALKKKPTKE